MNRILDKKMILIVATLTSTAYLSGCGKTSDEEKALAVFSTSVSEFADYIKDTNEKINSLDASQEESVIELLEILDDMVLVDIQYIGYTQWNLNNTDRQHLHNFRQKVLIHMLCDSTIQQETYLCLLVWLDWILLRIAMVLPVVKRFYNSIFPAVHTEKD